MLSVFQTYAFPPSLDVHNIAERPAAVKRAGISRICLYAYKAYTRKNGIKKNAVALGPQGFPGFGLKKDFTRYSMDFTRYSMDFTRYSMGIFTLMAKIRP